MKETSRHFFRIYFYWTINEHYKIKATVVYEGFLLTDRRFDSSCESSVTFCMYVTFRTYSSKRLWDPWCISHKTSARRIITSLYFTCVQITFSLGLILLVWSFIRMYDPRPKAARSSDMNDSKWRRGSACSYRSPNDLIAVCHLVKTEGWAAADRSHTATRTPARDEQGCYYCLFLFSFGDRFE